MRLVYIAGPFSADTPEAVEKNIQAAEKVARLVATWKDCAPVCPHAMGRNMQDVNDYEYWIEATAEMLKRCDAIVMTRAWQKSSGAKGERELAEKLGLQIIYQHNSYPRSFFALKGEIKPMWKHQPWKIAGVSDNGNE